MSQLTVTAIAGLPEIERGADLAGIIVAAADDLADGDILVIAQKAVSKSEGRMAPSAGKLDAALAEAKRVVRRRGDLIITETRHGFICANSGVDTSNVPEGLVALLPEDPDRSARSLRARINHLSGKDVAVIVSDTFGRAWREGQTNVAIGVAGMSPFIDYRGTFDTQGKELKVTRICVADELAAAAELVMGKATGCCVAIVRGGAFVGGRGSAAEIIRTPEDDLFR